ncbi:MAG: hypothetical protein JWO38_6848 [Gemmataceae bacterium]|nr:hypothetical protein [Gemmataceae bacterium]
MALPAAQHIEVRTTGSDTNGGGFNPSNVNFPTDLTATSANTASPVVSSPSYTFGAGDVGAYLFIKSGTNLIPGWYLIVSVSAGSATLNAAVGAVVLYLNGTTDSINTTAGCATVASPTAGTFGVDYSQQNAAEITYTDLVIGATTTQFTSVANPVSKALTGNTIQITGGTGFTVGFYEVVSTTGTTATCDRSLGTAASTGGTGAIGGALATFGKAVGTMVASNTIWAKSGAYTTAAQLAPVAGAAGAPSVIRGYGTIRTDKVQTTTLTATASFTAVFSNVANTIIRDMTIDGGGSGKAARGVSTAGTQNWYDNLIIQNCTAIGINLNSNSTTVSNSRVTGTLTGGTAGINLTATGSANRVIGCRVDANAVPGIVSSQGNIVVGNLVYGNTGATSDGIQLGSITPVWGNIVYGNGRDGIRLATSTAGDGVPIFGNVIVNNSGVGLNSTVTVYGGSMLFCDYNAFFNNTGGARTSMPIGPHDVTLTGDPFVNAAGGNFAPNATAGAGAALKAAGWPGVYPGGATQGYVDIGVQHQDAGGAAGMLYVPSLDGV